MNLLMISGDRALASGKRGALYNTLEELHKHFERIDIICPKVTIRRYDMVLFGNVHVHPSPWPLLFQPFWIRRQGTRLVREHHHALATVHEYPPFYNGIGARLLHRATKIPYLLEVHGHQVTLRWQDPKGMFYGLLERMLYAWDAKPAKAVRVVNSGQGPAYLKKLGVPESKIIVVPSVYLDHDVFKPLDVPKEYDVVFVGSLLPNKNPDFFLDVVKKGKLRGLIVGGGPLQRHLKFRVQNERLRVKFTGVTDDSIEVATHINSARLLLMTSFNEGGPRVIAEALACGVPVISTPVGIASDLVAPECIEEHDIAAFTDKVKNLLAQPNLYARIREAGMYATQRLDRTTSVTALADALKRLTL